MTTTITRTLLTLAALSALPNVFGFSAGPPALRAGVPGDAAGVTCTACHRTNPVNPDTIGKATVTAGALRHVPRARAAGSLHAHALEHDSLERSEGCGLPGAGRQSRAPS